jgi:hypothetical protein
MTGARRTRYADFRTPLLRSAAHDVDETDVRPRRKIEEPEEEESQVRLADFRVLTLVIILVAPASAGAQSTTPWGDPDLQGIWTSQTPVPLERPEGLAGKAFFTREEAAAFEKAGLARLLGLTAAQVPFSGELNEIWLEAQDGRVPNRRTSLVIDPPDGRIPYTPEGRTRWDSGPTIERVMAGTLTAADGPEDRAEAERCLTSGGLFIPNPFYNNYHQIVQTQGYVAILTEMMHEARIIPLDRRPHLGPGIRQWLGDSRGRWEGQTLVVETTNFNDQRFFRGATRQLRLVERFTRLDAATIDYQLSVTDPATFATTWTLENTLRRTPKLLFEVACHEGNYGLAGILSGARAQERDAARTGIR